MEVVKCKYRKDILADSTSHKGELELLNSFPLYENWVGVWYVDCWEWSEIKYWYSQIYYSRTLGSRQCMVIWRNTETEKIGIIFLHYLLICRTESREQTLVSKLWDSRYLHQEGELRIEPVYKYIYTIIWNILYE